MYHGEVRLEAKPIVYWPRGEMIKFKQSADSAGGGAEGARREMIKFDPAYFDSSGVKFS